MVVEKLLQFFIGEVDAQLLQAVELETGKEANSVSEYEIHSAELIKSNVLFTYIKDFKPSNIQDADEELSRLLCVQHLIDSDDHPQEHFLIDGLAQSTDSIVDLEIRFFLWYFLRIIFSYQNTNMCQILKSIKNQIFSITCGTV